MFPKKLSVLVTAPDFDKVNDPVPLMTPAKLDDEFDETVDVRLPDPKMILPAPVPERTATVWLLLLRFKTPGPVTVKFVAGNVIPVFKKSVLPETVVVPVYPGLVARVSIPPDPERVNPPEPVIVPLYVVDVVAFDVRVADPKVIVPPVPDRDPIA